MCRVTSCNDFELHPGDLNPQQSDKVTVDRRVEEKGMSRALSLDLVKIDVGPQIQYCPHFYHNDNTTLCRQAIHLLYHAKQVFTVGRIATIQVRMPKKSRPYSDSPSVWKGMVLGSSATRGRLEAYGAWL